MIMADSFVQSEKARNNEFTTNESDRPLIVQFAATNPEDFARAAELVSPYCDGVDLNCGCPQRWAMKLGMGAHMLTDPESIRNIIRRVKTTHKPGFSVSVKIRLLDDIRRSVDLCEKLEKTGADFLTVHGRTKDQKSGPVNIDAIKIITESVTIPIVANGDVKSAEEAREMHELTGCRGVMAARGLLTNPALFSEYNKTPRECVEDWISIALSSNLYFVTFHHHLVFMLEKVLPRNLRRVFNGLSSYHEVISFLNDYFQFSFSDIPSETEKSCLWKETTKNKFFLEKTEPDLFLNDLFPSSEP